MVKVNFKPWKEVVIHESIQFSLDTLVTIQSLGLPRGQVGRRLLWAEGVAFNPLGMPTTADIIKENLEGRVHWSSVEWALMPEYKPHVEISQTKVRIPILNVSSNKTLSEVAEWLKRSANTR